MLADWIAAIEGWVPTLASSVWVYFALALFATIDGFFPPIPSESVVIALASLSVANGQPHLLLIGVAAALGAFTGDQIAYTIGSKVNVRRMRLFHTAKGKQALDWAEHALVHRGSSFILAARYIPIGRVAVNMTAGALGYPRRRFIGLTSLAAVTWACYGTVIGIGAGVWLQEHPVLAVVVGVIVGTLVGFGIDWALRKWTNIGAAPTQLPGGAAHAVDARTPTTGAEDSAAHGGTPVAETSTTEGAAGAAGRSDGLASIAGAVAGSATTGSGGAGAIAAGSTDQIAAAPETPGPR